MKPRQFTLPAGAIIAVRTTSELSTAKVKDGSVFETVLENDLVVDGTTLARRLARQLRGGVGRSGADASRQPALSVAARSIAGTGNNAIPIKTVHGTQKA